MTSPTSWLSDGPRLDGVRVLVVDDTRQVREVVAHMLAQDGAKVTAVGSAEEALAALQVERPDVLLSDLAMPGKGGYWLIGQVRALPPERGGVTPAAALTAFTGPEHRASVLRAGFQLHVEKPIGFDALIDAVAMLALKDRVPSGARGTAGLPAHLVKPASEDCVAPWRGDQPHRLFRYSADRVARTASATSLQIRREQF